jgi:hypothetical protein
MNADELFTQIVALAADVRRGLDSLWPADLRRCQHKHATMVQQIGELGWFVTWQCDDCGMPDADRPVTADDLARGAELPWFDREACLRGIERLERRRQTTLAFFGKATKR